MKKICIIFAICINVIVCLITMSGCKNGEVSNSDNVHEAATAKGNSGDVQLKYGCISCGYISELKANTDSKIVIKSKEELNEYVKKYDQKKFDAQGTEIDGTLKQELDKYDEKFFKSKSLALCYISVSSGSIGVEPQDPVVDGDTLKIIYNVNIPEIGTCDMQGYVIDVEVSKNINEIEVEEHVQE